MGVLSPQADNMMLIFIYLATQDSLEAVLMFAHSIYLMFSAVYVCKETVEHISLSLGATYEWWQDTPSPFSFIRGEWRLWVRFSPRQPMFCHLIADHLQN